jgi:hypothetical protein
MRPNLAYAVVYVSCFMEQPTTEHLLAVKRLLRYVAGTLHVGCFYKTRKEKKLKLVAYSDIDTRKSTTGVLFSLETV